MKTVGASPLDSSSSYKVNCSTSMDGQELLSSNIIGVICLLCSKGTVGGPGDKLLSSLSSNITELISEFASLELELDIGLESLIGPQLELEVQIIVEVEEESRLGYESKRGLLLSSEVSLAHGDRPFHVWN